MFEELLSSISSYFQCANYLLMTFFLFQYACRKALADNQPRVRGRFAKTEEAQVSKGIEVENGV